MTVAGAVAAVTVAGAVAAVAAAGGVSVVTVVVCVTAEAEAGATAPDDPSARAEAANSPSVPVAATAATDEVR